MRVIDIYNEYKPKNNKHIIMIKSGIFFTAFNIDAGICNKILGYKINSNGSNYSIGFPSNSIDKVINTIQNKQINYIVLNKDDSGNYYIQDKCEYDNNQYDEYKIDYNRLNYLNKRINDISKELQNKLFDSNIENILLKVEELIK